MRPDLSWLSKLSYRDVSYDLTFHLLKQHPFTKEIELSFYIFILVIYFVINLLTYCLIS
jgi:hypothetical protein